MKVGQTITLVTNFKRDPGLYDPTTFSKSRTTDGKSANANDDVLLENHQKVRHDADRIVVARFTALRVGEAEIGIFDGRTAKQLSVMKIIVK